MTTPEYITVTSAESRRNGKMLDPQKEQARGYAVITKVPGKEGLRQPITARVWVSRSSGWNGTVYASIFVHNNFYTSGHGRATGYGYHKASAALEAAAHSAGFKFSKEFGGAGDNAIEEALLAIAAHLGCVMADTTVVSL